MASFAQGPNEPEPGISDETLRASQVFGTELRILVIQRLSVAGSQSVSDLASALQRSSKSIEFTVAYLEERGVVTGDRPRGDRNGLLTTYAIDAAHLRSMLKALERTVIPTS